jgi:hypothetical protein
MLAFIYQKQGVKTSARPRPIWAIPMPSLAGFFLDVFDFLFQACLMMWSKLSAGQSFRSDLAIG